MGEGGEEEGRRTEGGTECGWREKGRTEWGGREGGREGEHLLFIIHGVVYIFGIKSH